jgi:NAD(P)-dependent dehydrogenase (short-subunit alcohol dehydrogenase family)
MSTAIITGASRGLGLALAHALHTDGWTLVLTARNPSPFPQGQDLWKRRGVTALTGDVADLGHRQALVDAAGDDLTLLVNNASFLGPSPQPNLADYPLDVFRQVYEVNVTAPLALAQLALPTLRANHGRILNITSDASVEPYAGWGGYGSSKAALNQLSRILDAEEPDVAVTAVDPGDMRTQMHQEAFPGEDISDRPLPEEHAVPALLALINSSTVLEGATP